MSDIMEACDTLMAAMRVACSKTRCIKCIPEKELGYCPWEKLRTITDIVRIMDD